MEAINHIQNSDFVEFSKAVKQELFNKLSSNPFIKSRADQMQQYSKAENAYKSVVSKQEPEDEE